MCHFHIITCKMHPYFFLYRNNKYKTLINNPIIEILNWNKCVVPLECPTVVNGMMLYLCFHLSLPFVYKSLQVTSDKKFSQQKQMGKIDKERDRTDTNNRKYPNCLERYQVQFSYFEYLFFWLINRKKLFSYLNYDFKFDRISKSCSLEYRSILLKYGAKIKTS